MSEIKVVGASQVKAGSFIVVDGSACKIIDSTSSKSGKHGHAKIRLVAVGLLDEKKRELVMPAHDTVEVPIIEKRNAQVLSVAGEKATIMDSESFETFEIKIPEEFKNQTVEGVSINYWNIMGDKIIKGIKGGVGEQ